MFFGVFSSIDETFMNNHVTRVKFRNVFETDKQRRKHEAITYFLGRKSELSFLFDFADAEQIDPRKIFLSFYDWYL